jgi:hypothetical protein
LIAIVRRICCNACNSKFVILKLFVAMVVITVYSQCNSDTLNAIAIDIL